MCEKEAELLAKVEIVKKKIQNEIESPRWDYIYKAALSHALSILRREFPDAD